MLLALDGTLHEACVAILGEQRDIADVPEQKAVPQSKLEQTFRIRIYDLRPCGRCHRSCDGWHRSRRSGLGTTQR
jgi:hypothetical protein